MKFAKGKISERIQQRPPDLDERLGVDRAKYGERLMDDLSETLRKLGLSRCDRRELYRYRQFYLTYPQIVEAVAPQLTAVLQNKKQWQLLQNSKMPCIDRTEG